VTPPRPTAEAVRRSANAPAVVEGRVSDEAGRPVAGVVVWGLPHDKDLGWSSPAVTDAGGRFRLSLVAPGNYGFLLGWRGISVVTSLTTSRTTAVFVPPRPRTRGAASSSGGGGSGRTGGRRPDGFR